MKKIIIAIIIILLACCGIYAGFTGNTDNNDISIDTPNIDVANLEEMDELVVNEEQNIGLCRNPLFE